ncbi:MAG: hypothetical protein PHD51_01735 [Patescibacteria group bacterium]|nr:hypothetical protein [Patescibacteria group bacterium]MDD5490416.1 hypothetical protein [Patescibacteria group bacterium]
MENTITTIQAAPNQYEIMLNNYAAIVEKTNQQMSYWFDPYILIIASLTALFTVGTIVAAVVIYWNSREGKRKLDDIIRSQKKEIEDRNEREDQLSKEREKKAKKYEESTNDLIQEYQKKLKNLDSLKDKKERKGIEKIIDELNKSKASLGSYAIPQAREQGIFDRVRTCSSCGKPFQYIDWFLTTQIGLVNKTVDCPHCGATNLV